jgi:hypothetical protein
MPSRSCHYLLKVKSSNAKVSKVQIKNKKFEIPVFPNSNAEIHKSQFWLKYSGSAWPDLKKEHHDV